jgi:hypothetical protein
MVISNPDKMLNGQTMKGYATNIDQLISRPWLTKCAGISNAEWTAAGYNRLSHHVLLSRTGG